MAEKKFIFKYGAGRVSWNLPGRNFLKVIEPEKTRTPVKKFSELFSRCLRKPDFGRPLAKILKRGRPAVIVVSDRTRATGSDRWLPLLLDELNGCGIPDRMITVIFALGGHRRQTKSEQLKLLGRAADRIKFFDHDARNSQNLKKVGDTSRGTPVLINRYYLEAPNKIITGLITYHYFAGFTGGRKSVVPGLAGLDTIQKNHRLLFSRKSAGPGSCTTGVLKENPLSADMLEAARMAPPDFMINFVFNSSGRPLKIFSGEFEKAHEKGCDFFNRAFRVKINQPADLVVASAGGFPKDVDFIQAHKAVDNAVKALKPGGVLIFLAEVRRPFPDQRYLKAFRLGDVAALEKSLSKEYSVPVQTCRAFLKKAARYIIIWVSPHMKRYAKLMKIQVAPDMAAAIRLGGNFLSENFRGYVIPNASLVLPEVKEK